MSLSTLELSQLRDDCEDYLPDTCTLRSVTRTSDGQGGWSEEWADAHTAVECRLIPLRMTRGERVQGGELVAETSWRLVLHHDQAVTEQMRVVHGGETYEITQLEDTHSQRGTKRAYLSRLD